MARPSRYLLELRRRAVRMFAEVGGDCPKESATLRVVAQKPGIGSAETLAGFHSNPVQDANHLQCAIHLSRVS